MKSERRKPKNSALFLKAARFGFCSKENKLTLINQPPEGETKK
jgi:hypothetical protein